MEPAAFALSLVATLFFFAACSPATSPTAPATPRSDEASAVQLPLGQNYSVVVTDVTRRVVHVDLNRFTICSEPPPGVSESTAASFANALAAGLTVGASAGAVANPAGAQGATANQPQAANESGAAGEVAPEVSAGAGAAAGAGVSANLSNDLVTAAASIAQTIFIPTQGIQLYGTASFNLCQAWLNNLISREEYVRLQEELLKLSRDLILAELFLVRAGAPQNSSQDFGATLEQLSSFIKNLPSAPTSEGDSLSGGQTRNDVIPPTEKP